MFFKTIDAVLHFGVELEEAQDGTIGDVGLYGSLMLTVAVSLVSVSRRLRGMIGHVGLLSTSERPPAAYLRIRGTIQTLRIVAKVE